MSAARILREAEALGIRLSVAGNDRIDFEAPADLTGETLERILAEVRRHKPEIVAALRPAGKPAQAAGDQVASKLYLHQRHNPETGEWETIYRAPDPFLTLPVDELLRQMAALAFKVSMDGGRIVVEGDWPASSLEDARKALEGRRSEVQKHRWTH